MRTISTYSRVFVERLAPRLAVPALDDLRPGRAEPEQEAAAGEQVERGRRHRAFAGVRPGICMIAEPILIVVVVAAIHASTLTASVPQASAAHAES